MAKIILPSETSKLENLPSKIIDFESQDIDLFSKVVSSNINGFSVYSDEQLAMELFSYLYMLCKRKTPNIYGNWTFFLDDFAKLFNYGSNLTRFFNMDLCKLYLHSDTMDGINIKNIPAILQREKEYFLMNGLPTVESNRALAFSFQIFGNMLYELKEKGFPFSNKIITFINENGDTALFGKSNTLISAFGVNFNVSKRRIGIEFKPNLNLLENNYRLFDIMNLEGMGKLRRGNLTKGYFAVTSGLNEILTGNQEIFKLKVNDGCKAFNINFTDLKKNKYELKLKLEELNQFMPQTLKFNITEDKLTDVSKHNYMLILTLENKQTLSKDDYNKINKIRYDSYYRSKLHNAYLDYQVNIPNNINNLSFEDWLTDLDIDKEYKMNAYIEAQAVVYKRKLTKDSPEVIYEFLPDITLTKQELRIKLKKDKAISVMERIEIKNMDDFKKRIIPLDIYYKDKALHHSIILFKQLRCEVASVIYNEKDEFFVLRKNVSSTQLANI